MIVSTSGDQYVMKIHGTNSSSIVVDSESGILPWMDPIGWLWDSEIGQNGSYRFIDILGIQIVGL